MFEEYVKNHTTEEIIAMVSKQLKLTVSAMDSAISEQNMYNLTANVPAVAQISSFITALDKKVNGPKSKVL